MADFNEDYTQADIDNAKIVNMRPSNLTVEVFRGEEASVNSYIFSNGSSQIVMDVLRNSREAQKLAERIRSKALPLTHILITHGHPDHYTGMDLLKKVFPEARIVVPSEAIKQDIIGFSQWMESVGWLDGEPTLKPKSADHPNGFDYARQIEVLTSDELTLEGGGTLAIATDYPAAEAEHLSTVYSEDLNALFVADFCYNRVHLWLGQGVDAAHIKQWKSTLRQLQEKYGDTDVTVYPGHGPRATPALFEVVLQYISDFESVIATAATKEQAMEKMKERYPDWQQSDFLLLHSVNYQFELKK